MTKFKDRVIKQLARIFPDKYNGEMDEEALIEAMEETPCTDTTKLAAEVSILNSKIKGLESRETIEQELETEVQAATTETVEEPETQAATPPATEPEKPSAEIAQLIAMVKGIQAENAQLKELLIKSKAKDIDPKKVDKITLGQMGEVEGSEISGEDQAKAEKELYAGIVLTQKMPWE